MECPECGSLMVLREGKYGKFYGCTGFPACKATHGAHQDSGEPLGIPADRETKDLRIAAHDAFDPMWQNGKLGRNEAYEWLAEMLEIPFSECHIGMFDKEMCQKVIEVCGE